MVSVVIGKDRIFNWALAVKSELGERQRICLENYFGNIFMKNVIKTRTTEGI